MTCEPDEAHFALLLRVSQRFGDAVRSENPVRIIFVDYFVNLPDIKMIGLEAAEGLLKLLHGNLAIPSMRAYFRHHDGTISLAFQRRAKPRLAFALVILPRVVEE